MENKNDRKSATIKKLARGKIFRSRLLLSERFSGYSVLRISIPFLMSFTVLRRT